MRVDLIASVIPDVTSSVVGTLAEDRTVFCRRITASVFVPPTSTPIQSHGTLDMVLHSLLKELLGRFQSGLWFLFLLH